MITLPAHAKINLSLDVTGKLDNGYHTLEMILQTISLKDEVILQKKPEGVEISCDNPQVPCDGRNICDKAARAFFEKAGIPGGVRIQINKRIPLGAGLGGGSTNAAAVLKGLNALYDARLTQEQLLELGLQCGADVPFCLTGGTCLAGNRRGTDQTAALRRCSCGVNHAGVFGVYRMGLFELPDG